MERTDDVSDTREPSDPPASGSHPIAASPGGQPVHTGSGGHHLGPGESLIAAQGEEFHDRWRDVQALFVDDPAGAVRSAEELLGDVAAAITKAVESRRSASGPSGEHDTEALRTQLQEYRGLAERLLAI